MVEYVSIALLCTVVGGAIGVATFSRNKSKDDRTEGQQSGQILTELGYIKANTDEIKIEQKEQRNINQEVLTRLTRVEASAERAHYRLDRVEGKEHPKHINN